MANVVTEISKKVLIALGTGAGALLAKAATEKSIGAAIKAIQDKKSVVQDVAETVATDANPADVVTEAMETVEAVAEEVGGA